MRTLSYIVLVLAFISCEERRSFEADDFQKQMVLNAIISTDLSWDVSLSYTKSIFDESDFSLIENAEVKVLDLDNGQSFYLDRKKTGNYFRELHPVEGHEYLIKVVVPGEDELKAMTYVPSVLEVDVESKLVPDEQGNENIEIDIEISDNPNEENFYVWELVAVDPQNFEEDQNNPIASSEVKSDIITNSSSENLEPSEGSEDPESEGSLSKDDLSSDDIYNFNRIDEDDVLNKRDFNVPSFLTESDVRSGKIANKLIFDSSFISDINSNYSVSDPDSNDLGIPLFELKVMAVSSDLYEYLRTYEDYKQNDIKNTSISDPVVIHSNIENGLGIFGGYNLKSFYIY